MDASTPVSAQTPHTLLALLTLHHPLRLLTRLAPLSCCVPAAAEALGPVMYSSRESALLSASVRSM